MSQLLLNESKWSSTLKSNQKMNKRQSIKLKIELPKSPKLNKTQIESDYEDDYDDTDYKNATIRLEISFDTRQTPKRFKKNETQQSARQQIRTINNKPSSLSTSGYSSSNSSMINYIQDKSFYIEEYNHINLNGNIYDKLDYKRRSLASNNSSMSSSSSSSSNDNEYEEISNFSQMKSYENETSSNKNKLSKSCYKREYTINEIFQNLKEFKSEAKQQEFLLTTSYTDLKQPKSVSFLKQIFESKSKQKTDSLVPPIKSVLQTSNAAESRLVQNKDNTTLQSSKMTTKTNRQNHVYVNEKISRPINV